MFKDSNFHHIPVLYQEVIDSLEIKPDGVYVDCTAGGGGHSSGIYQALSPAGTLVALDRDPAALSATQMKLESLNQSQAAYHLVEAKFSELARVLNDLALTKIDGLIADLGLSSAQIDRAERGFSFQQNGDLDMRMSPANPMTAADFVNRASRDELARVIRLYGEEKFAGRIADNIVKIRQARPFRRTFDLVDAIKAVVPAKSKREQHPAKRTFQAIRIYVNQELAELEKLLELLPDLTAPGARIAIISFHSLEDRLVKQAFQKWEKPCTCPKDFPVCVCGLKPLGHILNRKGITAGQAELEANPRSRSARLRVFVMN